GNLSRLQAGDAWKYCRLQPRRNYAQSVHLRIPRPEEGSRIRNGRGRRYASASRVLPEQRAPSGVQRVKAVVTRAEQQSIRTERQGRRGGNAPDRACFRICPELGT